MCFVGLTYNACNTTVCRYKRPANFHTLPRLTHLLAHLFSIALILLTMDSFTTTTSKKIEDVVLPPVNEDGGTGSSGSCVVCKEDTSLPPVNEDGGTGSSGSCVIA